MGLMLHFLRVTALNHFKDHSIFIIYLVHIKIQRGRLKLFTTMHKHMLDEDMFDLCDLLTINYYIILDSSTD